MSGDLRSREVRRKLARKGFEVKLTKGGHYRVSRPDMATPVFASATPSSNRFEKTLMATVKRSLRAGAQARAG